MGYLVLAMLICVLWSSAAIIPMLGYLERRGVGPRLVWRNFTMPDYARQYRAITRRGGGRTGALFYHFVIPLHLALLLAVSSAILVRI
jgi:hypothetical protein